MSYCSTEDKKVNQELQDYNKVHSNNFDSELGSPIYSSETKIKQILANSQ